MSKKLSILILQELAGSKGGKCLSTKFKYYDSIYKWQCSERHTFFNKYCYIKSGTWCPDCNIYYKKETFCRKLIEKIFDRIFVKAHPKFLRGKELDGFNEELKVAFEYNGEGHYKIIKQFKLDEEKLKLIQKNDRKKIQLCKKNNVKLIVIPYWIKLEDIKEYIVLECEKQNIFISNKNINIDDINIYNSNKYRKLKEIIINNGGKLISKVISPNNIVKVICNNNHHRTIKANSILSCKYIPCPKCSNNEKKTLNDLLQIINKKGGKLLSNVYKSANMLYEFQCKRNHIWKTKARYIFDGNWCNKCHYIEQKEQKLKSKRYNISDIEQKYNCKCLTNYVDNIHKKYLWQCQNGHINQKSLRSLIGVGFFRCWECAGSKPKTIDDMKSLAEKYNGRFLSNNYKNMHVRYLWECGKGHQWYRVPQGIEQHWCPICWKENKGVINA
jgi:hypothetical protein